MSGDVAAAGPVPVPPFTDAREAREFHHRLMLHLWLVGGPGGPRLHQFVLAQVLTQHTPAWSDPRGCPACATAYPCRAVLAAALASGFDAPWTPAALVRALRKAGFAEFAYGADLGGDRLAWGTDPQFSVQRGATGRWSVWSTERGQQRREAADLDDRALRDWLYDFALEYPMPYGTTVDERWVEAAKDGARTADRRWERRVRLPYLQDRPRPDLET